MDDIDIMQISPPFSVRTYGWARRNPRHFTPGTKQGDVMLILNLEGKGIFRNSKGERTVGPSMVGLIPPEDPGVFFADLEDPYVHSWCRFQGAYALHLVEQILADKEDLFFPHDSIRSLSACMSSLPPVLRQKHPDQMGEYELGLARILVTLAQKKPERTPRGLTHHALMTYLETHIDQRLVLDDMAAHFHMTKPSLCRAGKRLLGNTIIQTSNALRITYAKQLLDTSAMNVTEVAYRVGFDDPLYFSRVFKSAAGQSPKHWQQDTSRSLS
jgi:AraC-like DNA-binding protein